jgi:Protein of unknown function (DUF1344)
MRKMLGLALGTAIAVGAGIASAQDQNVQGGTIEDIDPAAETIVVDGKTYQMPDETTAGTALEENKVGDKVDITLPDEDRGGQDSLPRAMMVEKVE